MTTIDVSNGVDPEIPQLKKDAELLKLVNERRESMLRLMTRLNFKKMTTTLDHKGLKYYIKLFT
jgi:hypothetical protein